MTLEKNHITYIYGVIVFLCFTPFISPAIALSMGIFLSFLGIKISDTKKYISISLQASIVLTGFGMSLTQVVEASKSGFIATAISVVFVMVLGYILGKLLKVDSKTTTLISAGTAICGGSAIAAITPIINSKSSQTSFALAVVFTLNAVALIIFPYIGHYFNLSQETFGYWVAIAIHDTSSVVGAGATYGPKALEIATTVKLIRALWIIPLSIVIGIIQKDKSNKKTKFPWFIGLFILSILIAYLFPKYQETFSHFTWLGKRGMVLALFLIGTNISIGEIKKAGVNSFILGIILWVIIATLSLISLY